MLNFQDKEKSIIITLPRKITIRNRAYNFITPTEEDTLYEENYKQVSIIDKFFPTLTTR